jgi:hypothetical protein
MEGLITESESAPFGYLRLHLHLEQDLFILLVSLCLDLFSELDDGLELGVVLFSLFVLYVIHRGWSG